MSNGSAQIGNSKVLGLRHVTLWTLSILASYLAPPDFPWGKPFERTQFLLIFNKTKPEKATPAPTHWDEATDNRHSVIA